MAHFDNLFDSEDENDFDIIVVGGGLTGLTAAYNILERHVGLDVLILERNNAIGGRIISQTESKFYYGHSLQKNITHMLDTFDIPKEFKIDIGEKQKVLFTKNGPLENKLPSYIAGEIHYFLKAINSNSMDPKFKIYSAHEEAEDLSRISIDQLICRLVFLPQSRSICRTFISLVCGINDTHYISALWVLVMLHGANGLLTRLKIVLGDEHRYFVKNGMMSIAEELVRRIEDENGEMHCKEQVNTIQFNNDRVYVTTDIRTYRCNHVIIAVPPQESVLIQIQPEPPINLIHCQNLFQCSKTIFFNATYKTPFWHTQFSGDIISTWNSKTKLRIAYDASSWSKRESVIAGFISESNQTSRASIDLFDVLNACFKSSQSRNYIDYKETQGNSMNVPKPDNINHHINPMFTPWGRIFFASSEYAPTWPGTVDGALESGNISACLLLMRTRPQALSPLEIISCTNQRVKPRPSQPIRAAMLHKFSNGVGFDI
ncbi:probable flavin-containing monoamine oxidase A isoform X2 [Cephus cinctus]|uniref:Amine oxidase n=1 Tax=Cephus cinctus TaxID=211228 RepID=A0AAJ7W4J8_CEPCN|nr:probable flavin-containing monoamine oxidase A isoform X2 [Cephus cinctus]